MHTGLVCFGVMEKGTGMVAKLGCVWPAKLQQMLM